MIELYKENIILLWIEEK